MDIERLIGIESVREFFNIEDTNNISARAREFMEVMDSAVFEPGEEIVSYGDTSESGMYIILKGSAEVVSPNGIIVNNLVVGDFIGERALIKDDVRAATVRALEYVECAHISRALFEDIADKNRRIYAFIIDMLYEKTTRLVMKQQRINTELEIAAIIQESMLEHDFSHINLLPDIHFYAETKPAKEVGGDFYDVFMIDENRLCFLVADVAGKSISAAMFMMMSKTYIKNFALVGMPINEVAFKTNNALAANNAADIFVTAFLCVLDITTGQLQYVNCGHNRPYISRNGNDFVMMSKDEAQADLVIGVIPDTPYSLQTTNLYPGDKIFMYTDGITEALNNKGEFFDDSGLMRALNDADKTRDPKEFVDDVYEAMMEFVGDAQQSDDVTMVYLSR